MTTAAPTPPPSLGARRRRPALGALSVALIVAGGLGSAALYATGDERVEVLAVARVVPYGQTLTDADLRVVRVTLDDGVKPVGASRKAQMVGRRAAVELRPGTLLTQDQVTDTVALQPGQMLVGVAVERSHLPVQRLTPGMQVVIVSTPRRGDDPPDTQPRTIRATVVRVGEPDDAGGGTVVVDVAVPANDGPALAARAFTERVAIVVLQGGSGS